MFYEFRRDLGHGTYGRVLLAECKGEPRGRVAIKMSRPGDVNGLRAEYEMLCKVASPFIFAAIDFLEGPDA